MTASLRVEVVGHVAVWTIDRRQVRNALDVATLDALAEAIESASHDENIGAAVLTGAGDVCFSAGMDLRDAAANPASVGPAVARFHTALGSADRLPLVAAVRGMAVGGGFEIALGCDLVVASTISTFRLPEVGRGLVPGGGALQLPARLPLALAHEIALLGDDVTAERCLAVGLVNRVVDDTAVLKTAVGLADRLAAQPRGALRRTRALLELTAHAGAAASLEAFNALGPGALMDAEAEAGIRSFSKR